MRKLFKLTVAGLVLAAMSSAVYGEPLRRERQERQQNRIGQGVRSGELTRGEAIHAERRQVAIARDIRDAKRSGGVVTPREKARIQQEQNRASRQIYRDKHDGQQQH